MQTIINAAMPHLLEILGLIITAIIGWAAAAARAKWGIDVEARHREALHTALMTAARLALANQLTTDRAVGMIVDYAKQSVPDAIGALRPSPGVLDDLARSKLSEVNSLDLREETTLTEIANDGTLLSR